MSGKLSARQNPLPDFCLSASFVWLVGEKVLFLTDYIKWCPSHGFFFSNCHQLIRYNQAKPKSFVDFVNYNFRIGDANVD